jgi:uncharacterized protein
MTTATPHPVLTAIEARVLGTLMEKARTVPDSYPLSLNSLLLGCNQKTSREPLMELEEAQVATATATLMLRGPQTAGELRLNTERWYRFADISSVEGFLDELLERSEEKGGPLVVKLPRLAGTREQRWAHLLCGPVDISELEAGRGGHASGGTAERVERLEQEVAALRLLVSRLCAELGVN